jgi:hypothetical protein
MKIYLLALILLNLALIQCTTLAASNQGGGGTQGVAIEAPDNLQQTWMIRTWKVDSLGQFDSVSSERTMVIVGQVAQIPNHSALELKSLDGKQIVYIAPRLWDGVRALKITADMVDSVVKRSIIASNVDQLSLDNSPYHATKNGNQFDLDQVPKSLRVIQTQSQSQKSEQLMFIQDTSVQKIYEVAKATSYLTNFPNHGYIWQGDSSLFMQDTNQKWWGQMSLNSDLKGWSLSLVDSMYVKHKLKADIGLKGVYKYTLVMDLKFDSATWWVPLTYNSIASFRSANFYLNEYGQIVDYLGAAKSEIKVSRNQWHRMAITIDVQDCKCAQFWVDGFRIWGLKMSLPKPHTDWSQLVPGVAGDFVLDAVDVGSGQVVAFGEGPNFKPLLSLKGMAYIQGVVPDSILALNGQVNP